MNLLLLLIPRIVSNSPTFALVSTRSSLGTDRSEAEAPVVRWGQIKVSKSPAPQVPRPSGAIPSSRLMRVIYILSHFMNWLFQNFGNRARFALENPLYALNS